jgi:hypothetical protein
MCSGERLFLNEARGLNVRKNGNFEGNFINILKKYAHLMKVEVFLLMLRILSSVIESVESPEILT